ncbi:hypothetical protein WJX73_000909 [Symbiochloris irregularis]|uniref:hydroxyethylthiazole kinase n=1 Tax=Symbiochloris irregularis TaxID=706552 RepID=A0AAW1P6F7_9CHLO
MDIMANVLLAAGASPAMVHFKEEVPEFTPKAAAVVVNVGTLNTDFLEGMLAAAEAATALSKPWVLDPIAMGGTEFRSQHILRLARMKPTLIRGNASDIMALNGAQSSSKGVDSTAKSDDALDSAKSVAAKIGSIVGITGATDWVTDGSRCMKVQNGVALMSKITATGSSVTALAAAFIAVRPDDPLLATACALCAFGVAAELASTSAQGPASLRVGLLDALHYATQDDMLALAKISAGDDH